MIHCCMEVHSQMEPGLLEHCYHNTLFVENKVAIELKSARALSSAHVAQLINYLHISKCRLGLLVNFQGRSLEWQRLLI